ncbi:MAG: hypothetical protein FLDDKLPJ_03504 [Phycisphaerae bacterium]|nr:hypothetical protein [Phycisphaerae bacterium]
MGANPEKLDCISIIICDDIYRDETTKRLVIVGTFNRINARSLPCRHPRMTVLFTITNGNGSYDLRVAIEHDNGEQLLELGGPLRVENPLAISDINLLLENVMFTRDGKHWVVVRADGQILTQRPFWVSVANAKGEAK